MTPCFVPIASTRASPNRSCIRRRMPAHTNPGASRGDEQRAIEFQRQHSRSTNRRQTFDEFAVGRPTKMLQPLVPARMEDANALTSLGIYGRNPSPFSVVARPATQPQVFSHCPTAERFGNQMIHLERNTDDRFHAQAVAATMSGIFSDQCAKCLGNVRSTHDGNSRATSWPRDFKSAAA